MTDKPRIAPEAGRPDWEQRIGALTDRLSSDDAIQLTPIEVVLMRAALERLASDEISILLLGRRLRRIEKTDRSVRKSLNEAISLVAERVDGLPVDQGFDFERSRQVRDKLADDLAQSRERRDIWTAALRVVVSLAKLL